MVIVWDEPKRVANIAKHGIDFGDIGVDFFLSAIFRPVRQKRWSAIGHFDSVIAGIFVALGSEGISIISARPASKQERKLLP